MTKNILSLAALLIASATFVACSNDDNIIDEQPVQPTEQVYTMTIEATKGDASRDQSRACPSFGEAQPALDEVKGDAATTRALSLDDKTLNATWATTENVYVQKGSTWADGSLQPQADGATATLKGTLSGVTIAADDELTLQFPRSGALDYTGQVGTLADIAEKYDYATASVTVSGVSATGNIIPTEATTTFTNQQAIVKFTLIDKADGTTHISATELVVSDGTTDYTVTPASATDVLYVAIPGFSGQTVTLTATVGGDTYTYEKSGVTFQNGQYYEITVKMTKAVTYKMLSAATAEDIGKVVCADGNIYDTKAEAEAAGTQAMAMIAYVGSKTDNFAHKYGIAIALSDEGSMTWSTAKSTCEGKTAVSGAAWLLPSQEQWKTMFKANGGDEGKYTGLNTALATAGDELKKDGSYWSSTPYDGGRAWLVRLIDAQWRYDYMDYYYRVRACLVFGDYTARPLAEATTDDLGKIAGADGYIYDTKAAAEAASTQAVAMIAYVGSETDHSTYKHGLAITLSNDGEKDWSTAKSICEGKTAVSGAAWMLPSQNQWNTMFKANGGDEGKYTGLNTALATAGGDSSKLQEGDDDYCYWSSTPLDDSRYARCVYLNGGDAHWTYYSKGIAYFFRACLAF